MYSSDYVRGKRDLGNKVCKMKKRENHERNKEKENISGVCVFTTKRKSNFSCTGTNNLKCVNISLIDIF